VLDNGAPYGDAVLPLESLGGNVCGVSSVGNTVLAQAMIAEAVRLLAERGVEPPVYLSANAVGGDLHNDVLEARFAARIHRSAA
jgi:uncharacterized phosphosugar-binding protein